jgi:hypothetical protein
MLQPQPRPDGRGHQEPLAEDALYWLDLEPGSHRPCGTPVFQISAHIALLSECNAAEKSPEKEGGSYSTGQECTNTREAFSHSRARSLASFFFFFKTAQHAGMYHACTAPVKTLPPPLSYINTLSCGLPISSTSCRPPLPSGSSVSLPLLFARLGISSAARLA